MKRALFFLLLLFFTHTLPAQETPKPDGQEEMATYIGTEAYIHNLPLVLGYQFRNRMKMMAQNSLSADAKMKIGNIEDGIQFNEWLHVLTLATHESKSGASPNDDTNYSIIFCNLSKDPIVLYVPPITDRYFALAVGDAYIENVHYIGSRQGNTKGGYWALVGPDFKGTLPKNMKMLKMEHNYPSFVMRIQCKGGEVDFKNVVAMQQKFTVQSLSKFMGKIKVDIKEDVPSVPKVNNGLEWFALMLKCMQECPPIDRDKDILVQMARIGLKIDGSTDINALTPSTKKGLEKAFENGKKIIDRSLVVCNEKTKTNWFYTYLRGNPGRDYLMRAHYSFMGLYTNVAEEALYPQTVTDKEGNALDGKNKYIIQIPKDKVAPAEAFWSFTSYIGGEFVPNKYFHYSAGDGKQYPVKRNMDGSVTIYLQNDPISEELGNWVPTPKEGAFRIIYRLYIPKRDVLNPDKITEYLPAVQKVE